MKKTKEDADKKTNEKKRLLQKREREIKELKKKMKKMEEDANQEKT
jgi:hypothetical protein